ncbi:MAG: site-specific integrase [Planctomycetota bacterium]|nr:MAG: site-specific integrase [Planctomycetota bacterium]
MNALPILKTAESLAEIARTWGEMEPEARHRRAAMAARDWDGEALVSLALGYLRLYSNRQLSKSTATKYRTCILGLVRWASGRAVSLLRPPVDFGRLWVLELEERKSSPSTVRVYLASAKGLFAALRWVNATEARPFERIQARPETTLPEDKRPPYGVSEVLRMKMAAEGPQELVVLLLAAVGGLRREEVRALEWADINLGSRELIVRKGKGGKCRRVRMAPELLRGLGLWQESCPWESVVGPISSRTVANTVQRLAGRAGVEWKGYHALRHTAGDLVYAATGSLRAVQRFLGHSRLETAVRYTHKLPELDRAIDAGFLTRRA